MSLVVYVILIVLVALVFDFYNGMNDAANSIATVVATRVLPPRLAVLWAAFFNFIAAFFFETQVASTIGKGLIDPVVVDPHLVLATLLAGIVWTAICTHFGLPISVSHALIGGLAGAALVKAGLGALIWSKLGAVAFFIVFSPLLGLAIAALIMIVTMWIVRHKRPRRVDATFRWLQLLSAAGYSLSHGLNDAQKTMGIILALLLSVPVLRAYATLDGTSEGHLRWWIILSCHGAIAMGTYMGGSKVIHTLGHKVTKLQPFDGFAAETGGGVTIIGLSLLGIPVSTTHTITGGIFGVGIVRRMRAVRWGVGGHIITAWVLTLPAAAALAALFYVVITRTVAHVIVAP
ncbi:MAG TPA: inorganic phosphate transporter [Phycisphaerae bacterium]|nr:inorganic phosphate transporter [Phycisphaerae bacterium]HNU46883.1 inorganic phosphate transporter [Phycisphaerae bacterium]